MMGVDATSVVWVRRCTACCTDDLRAAYGRAAIAVTDHWRCQSCGALDWTAVSVPFPTDASTTCPYQGRRRD